MQIWSYATVWYGYQAANPPSVGRTLVYRADDGSQWKYLQECLDEMGKNGWELVGTTPPFGLGIQAAEFFLLFKRPV